MFAVKTDIAAVNGLNFMRPPVTPSDVEQAANRDTQRTGCLLPIQRRLSPTSAVVATVAAVVISNSHDLGPPLFAACVGTCP